MLSSKAKWIKRKFQEVVGNSKDVSIHLWMIQFIKYFSQIWKKINHIAQYHSMKNFP